MTAKEASLTIPFPPTLNHNIGRNGGRYYKDDDYKRFQTQVGWLWLQAVPPLWSQKERYAVAIELIYDSNRRYDVDNRVKPILDALTKAGAWKDDSQVDAILVVRGEIDKDRPRAQVTIEILKRRPLAAARSMPADDRLETDAVHAADSSGGSLAAVPLQIGDPPQGATNGSGYFTNRAASANPERPAALDSEEEYEFEGENGWGLDEE